MFDKRVTLFMGHYGSGKTFTAVNYAIALKKFGKKVSLYDLDIVNPYFRTVDAADMLKKAGVNLVASPYAETNVDIPAMNSESYRMTDDKEEFAVVDVGGDDRGALALGRFSEKLKEENDYDALFVLNCFRPETKNIESAITIMKEIETVSRMPFTGIVNCANLGEETTENEVEKGEKFAYEFSQKTGLPIKFTAISADVIAEKFKNRKNVLKIEPIKYVNRI